MRSPRPRLLLVGAGHTHALLLRKWTRQPVHADVVVVADQPHSTYSGMIPGVLAGDYPAGAARIDVAALARRAGARFHQARATRIHADARRVELDDGTTLDWDLASLDVGSTLRGLDGPGVRKHAAATRPIAGLAAGIEERLSRLRVARPRIAVVGGGPAGVEIAFSLEAGLQARGRPSEMLIVCARDGLLPSYPPRARRLLAREADARGISILERPQVRFADSEGLGFESGRLDADLVVWATGPASVDFIANSPLPHDRHGFVLVENTLEVVGIHGLFAAGDCATLEARLDLAKSGVHAVRQAPVLEANLRAFVAGAPLSSWRPQRDSLSLLNLGGHRALAVKWGLAAAGRLPWKWKDRIDRSFVASFRDDQGADSGSDA